MHRRLTRITLSALAFLIVPLMSGVDARADTGTVSVSPGLEVTQSVQTVPQVLSEAIGPIGLSAHKPTAIRAYIRATRYVQINLGFATIDFPVFTPVSVNGSLTVKQGGSTIAILPASNGPISVTPWSTANPENINSSLNFKWAFPPQGNVTFEVNVTTSTAGLTVTPFPVIGRDFEHNERVRIQAVKLQYDHDNNLATPPTKSPNITRVNNGYEWFLKSGPLAPCKLHYWVNPAPLQWQTDLTSTSDGTLLGTLSAMKVQGSVTYDNVYGWWEESVAGNGLAQVPSCANPHSSGAYGNTQLSRYQRTFTHELYHNYCQQHLSSSIGQIGLVGFDTDLCTPVPDEKLDVMVAGQLTAAAWQSPSRYSFFYNTWLDLGAENLLDPCHFNWWPAFPTEFLPFGPEGIDPVLGNIIFINGIIDPTLLSGFLWPSFRVEGPAPPDPSLAVGSFSVQLIGLSGQIVTERNFEPHFEGDGDEPVEASFEFSVPTPLDPTTGALNLSEIRLLNAQGVVLDTIKVSANTPMVDQIRGPVLGQELKVPTLLQWTTFDADVGDRLHSAVQYSPDGGQHWIGLASNLYGTSYPLDPKELPGSDNAMIRVMVTDDLNTTTAEFGPFRVARGTPVVSIIAPESDPDNPLIVGQFKPLTLEGYAFSPDDGAMPGAQLQWGSDRQGILGQGYTLEARLQVDGDHMISLTATDKAGVQSVDTILVRVVPDATDTDMDGTPDYADRCPLDPGPPENGGCPTDPSTEPLTVKVTTRDVQGNERQLFDSFFDVFFEIEVTNTRATEVMIEGILTSLTDPAGIVMPMDQPLPLPLQPGETRSTSLSFFDVFGPTQNPGPGSYSMVAEPHIGVLEPVGREAAILVVTPNLRENCTQTVAGAPGTTVSVPITLNEGDGVAGFQVDVGFDATVLTPAGALLGADTAAAGGWNVSSALVGVGVVRVIGHSNPAAGLGLGPAEVALLQLQIQLLAPTGTSPLALSNCILSDDLGLQIPCDLCPIPGGVIVRRVDTFSFRPIPEPVGVDLFDPLPFQVSVEAQDINGNLEASYNGTADMTVTDAICASRLQPNALAFFNGLGTNTFTVPCCMDVQLPDTDIALTLNASDPSISAMGASDPFQGVAKGDIDASSTVDVLDVIRSTLLALNQPVATPPPVTFQVWAANMLDPACSTDSSINVLDTVRIVNKALLRPPLCPCNSLGNGVLASAPIRPVSVSLVREGPKSFAVMVSGAHDLGGLQFELRGAGRNLTVSPEGLTADHNWQVFTEPGKGNRLKVLAFSSTATGVSGDGMVLRITGPGKPTLRGLIVSDSRGREVPLQGGSE